MQIDLAALPDYPALLRQMLRDMAAAAEQRHTILQVAVQEREAENDKLRRLIQRLLRHQFGRRSEQLDPEQLQLGLEDLEQVIAEGEAAQDAAEPLEEQQQQRRAARRRNHGALPAHLPRYEVVIDVEDKACPCCAGALHLIGEDRSEQLDIVPSQLRVRVTRRPRYGCRACEGAVVQAPAPERPIDGGMATEALVAHIVVSKFCDHLPLVRGELRVDSKREYLRIVGELRERGAEGVILGCTEIFLLIAQEDLPGFPVFDTTELHVQAVVDFALG